MGIRAYLVNEEYQDPLLFVQFDGHREALLFDCGYLFPLKMRDIQRITSIFISHTHFDHFMGFDHILRLSLEQQKRMELYGPLNFVQQAACKLGGYSWNLCGNLELDFVACEVQDGSMAEAELKGREAYRLSAMSSRPFIGGLLKEHPLYTVSAAVLDHRIPSLAFSVKEKDSLRAKNEALEKLGLAPGPWVGELKELAEGGDYGDRSLTVEGRTYPAKALIDTVLEEKRGRKISYVVDTIFNKETVKRIVALAGGSDDFYCEAAYLTAEKEKARENYHLTAKQAGILAREARVGKLIPIHFSKRYDKRYGELIEEARREFPCVELGQKY
ncbi:MAG: ribonuclease Z [Candidatus Eremiobacteraeota bacterium]|nr:ribonuclease Z [Candidatus Eremiobacteraeota bacterium]